MRSAGQANLMDSMAVQTTNRRAAMDIENRLKWTESYYQMRQANRALSRLEALSRLSQEEIVRIARAGLPNRLTATQFDPLTGQFNWPIILRDPQYAPEREQLDKLFEHRAAASSLHESLSGSAALYGCVARCA